MSLKSSRFTGESLIYHKRKLSFAPFVSHRQPLAFNEVKPLNKIPSKFFEYFKIDLKTGQELPERKKKFLAQVLLHEFEEGVRTLERLQQFKLLDLLKQRNSKLHLANQILLLREWMNQDSINQQSPEAIRQGLKIRNNQEGALSLSFKKGAGVALSYAGIRYKPRNEDAVLLYPQRGFLGVCDGMGGHAGGNIASGVLVDFLEYALKEGATLEQSIEFANEAVRARAESDPHLGGKTFMGSTLVTAEIDGDQLQCTHVGDSKLMILREGKTVYETQDHTSGQDLLRNEEIDFETAHSLNHVLSRVLGHDPILPARDLALTRHVLKSKDRVVLATDGITDNFFNFEFNLDELAELACIGNPFEAARSIYHLALERVRKGELPDGRKAKPDNMTIVIYEHG